MTRPQVIDRYFLEHRAKLLDLAAYLDRLDRAGSSDEDFREAALRDAIAILIDGKPDRARRVLESLSDPTTDPIEKAPGKGACGAYTHSA
ncbi:MAG: hypothetical protein GVY24_00985 [Planctomycetes bacterium]|nr:hypothetical protein [Planctomycetota bacterium]